MTNNASYVSDLVYIYSFSILQSFTIQKVNATMLLCKLQIITPQNIFTAENN